jgi:hypothetical protein
MKQSMTAVLERNSVFDEDFVTEPYEAGWASEARWFVRTLELSAGARLRVATQISPDGLVWCDHESVSERICSETGLTSWPVHEFGQWLRLRVRVEGPSTPEDRASTKLLVYLALKS